MPKSKTCVVAIINGDIAYPGNDYPRCGKPVIGERDEYPLCAEHMALFDPDKENNANSD